MRHSISWYSIRRQIWLGLLVVAAAPSLQAAVVVDPNSLGQTDLYEYFSPTIPLTNPLSDPFDGSGTVIVGGTTAGALGITNGSDARQSQWWLGREAGSLGIVTVNGPGSTFQGSIEIRVGLSGEGRLLISNEAVVTTEYFYAGGSPSAVVEVSGAGSTLASSSGMFVGTRGTTEFRTLAGATASTSTFDLGYYDGAMTTGLVSGPGSKWDISENLNIGGNSPGSLTISDGGEVEVGGTTYLDNSFSPNTISLTLSGGTLRTGTLFTGGNDIFGSGTIHAHGLVADIPLLFDATHDATQIILLDFPMQNQTSLNLSPGVIIPGQLGTIGAGYEGNGTLTIDEGKQIHSTNGILGHNPNSVGIATIRGLGSKWTTGGGGDLLVGKYGTGILNVETGAAVEVGGSLIVNENSSSPNSHIMLSGGTVTAGTLIASPNELLGQGTFEVNGFLSDTELVFDQPGSSLSALHFNSLPGQNVTVSFITPAEGLLGVGNREQGSLTIRNGAQLTTGQGALGRQLGSHGAARIEGPNSKWTVGTLSMSEGEFSQGTGELHVTAGGEVDATDIFANHLGTIEVADANSTLKVANTFRIRSTGTLDPAGPVLHIHSGAAARFNQVDVSGYSTEPPIWLKVEGAASTMQVDRSSHLSRAFVDLSNGATLLLGTSGGPNGAIVSDLFLMGGSQFHLAGGTLDMQRGMLFLSQSTFLFESGTLRNFTHFGGDLNQLGGRTELRLTSGGSSQISGNFFLDDDAAISLQLRNTSNPLLTVTGSTLLQGELEVILPPPGSEGGTVALALGSTFHLIRSNYGFLGALGGFDLPSLPDQWNWELLQGSQTIDIRIFTGDYNDDGVVDAADYTQWRDTRGSRTLLAADGNRDGVINQQDYDLWRLNFGKVAAGYSPIQPFAVAAVPEPAAWWLWVVGIRMMFRRPGSRGKES